VKRKIHPAVGDAFANLRLVKFYEKPFLHTMKKISEGMKRIQLP
jgi:hypothetical protein